MGLAAVGVGGVVAGGKMFRTPVASQSASTTNISLSSGAGGGDSLLPSLIVPFPSGIGSSPDTLFSYDLSEAGNPWDTPSTFAWSDVGGLPDIPAPSLPNEQSSAPDTPTRSVTVPEASSISVLGAALLGIVVVRWRNHARFSRERVWRIKRDGLLRQMHWYRRQHQCTPDHDRREMRRNGALKSLAPPGFSPRMVTRQR